MTAINENLPKFAGRSHQPFEDWLLAEAELTLDEGQALQMHLAECEHCRRLSYAWRSVEGQLQAAPLIAPAAGFTARWQARLAADTRRRHRRQTTILLGLTLGGAMILLTLLALLAQPLLQNPQVVFYTGVYRLVRLFAAASETQGLLAGISRVAPLLLPVSLVTLVTGVATQLMVLWVVSYRVMSKPRRVTT
jgi:anti-sigma factor RsiW